MKEQCSIVSTRATVALMTPGVPWQWAETRLLRRCASLTRVIISCWENCSRRGFVPGVMPPPVAITLMKSAPAFTCARTARLISVSPSTSTPKK